MGGRFERGKSGGISPFFAFQDIITSAMAVVITIVMLLALDMGDPSAGSTGVAPAAQQAELESMLKALSNANLALERKREKAATAPADPERFRAENLALQSELANLKSGAQRDAELLTQLNSGGESQILELEIQKLEAREKAAAQEADKLKGEIAAKNQILQEAGKELAQREADLVAEEAQKNNLKLIPERTNTTKEAVVIVVSDTRFTVHRLGTHEEVVLKGNDLAGQLSSELMKFSRLKQYLVFLFKPSGTDLFNKVTSMARSKSFEIGYDTLQEDVNVTFGSQR